MVCPRHDPVLESNVGIECSTLMFTKVPRHVVRMLIVDPNAAVDDQIVGDVVGLSTSYRAGMRGIRDPHSLRQGVRDPHSIPHRR